MFEASRSPPRVGDQSALHAEIADGVLQLRDGRLERRLSGGHVGLHAADVGLYVAYFSGNGAHISFLFRHWPRGVPTRLVVAAVMRQHAMPNSFLVRPTCWARVSESASAIACAWSDRQFVFAGGLILRDSSELAVLFVNEKRRRADIGNGQRYKDPFADIALRLGW